jgi:NDP-hexose-3-ketoreductase
MAPVRFGIIACSSVARRRFLPALRASKLGRLEHVGSRDRFKAQQLGREFNCPKSGSYDEVLANPDVEAVYISTPPSHHDEWVNKSLRAGKHVLCEKPAFRDYRSAAEAIQRCRTAKLRLIEGYSFQWHPQHARVRALIAEHRIGQPRFFHAQFTYPRPQPNDIRLNPELAGGVFHDSAGYPVAAALLQMCAAPELVFSQAGQDTVAGVDNSLSVMLRFGSQIAQLLAAFDTHYRSRYSILGTRGRIEVLRAFSVAPDYKATVLLETDAGEERLSLEPSDQFQLMVEDVCLHIRGAGSRDFESELLRQHAVMDAAARSNREQRAVALSEYNL